MSYRRVHRTVLRPVRYPKQNVQEKVQSFLTEGTPPLVMIFLREMSFQIL